MAASHWRQSICLWWCPKCNGRIKLYVFNLIKRNNINQCDMCYQYHRHLLSNLSSSNQAFRSQQMDISLNVLSALSVKTYHKRPEINKKEQQFSRLWFGHRLVRQMASSSRQRSWSCWVRSLPAGVQKAVQGRLKLHCPPKQSVPLLPPQHLLQGPHPLHPRHHHLLRWDGERK